MVYDYMMPELMWKVNEVEMNSEFIFVKKKCASIHFCRVHKPGVPHGPASQQRLSPADNVVNDGQLMDQPKYLNKRIEG